MGARPVAEPVDHVVEPLAERLRMVIHRSDRLVGLRLPFRVAVREEPLVVDDLHDRAGRAAADDLAARLPHRVGLAFRRQLLADLVLCDLDPHARVGPAVLVQHAAVEAGLVDLGLGLLELLPVPLAPDAEPLDDLDARQGTPSLRADDRHRLDRPDPLRFQMVPGQCRLVLLQVPEGNEVVRRIGRHARHEARAAALIDEGAGKDRDRAVNRGRDRVFADQVGPAQRRLDDHRPALLGELLRGELVQDPSFLADLCDDVVGLRIGPEVRLPVDGLRPDRRRDEEPAVREGELEERVLHRHFALPLDPVVVPDRGLVFRAPDHRVLVDLDEVAVLEMMELPADERVVGRVERRRDEGPRPVDRGAEALQVLHRGRGEDLDPVHRVRELRDLAVRDPHLAQDVPLLRFLLGHALRGAEDGEARAMERLRMEDVVAEHPAVPRLELRPQERGPEPEVLESIHVRIGDGRVPFRAGRIGPRDVHVGLLPSHLPFQRDGLQVGALRTCLGLGPRPTGRAAGWSPPRLPRGTPRGGWPAANRSATSPFGFRPPTPLPQPSGAGSGLFSPGHTRR